MLNNKNALLYIVFLILQIQLLSGQTASFKKISVPINSHIDAWCLNGENNVFIISDSLIYISLNDGDSWNLYGKTADTSKVSSISVSKNGYMFYVTGSSYRYRSKDSAQSWDKYIPIGYYGPTVTSTYKDVDITRNGSLLLMQGDNLQNAWFANVSNDTVYQWTPLYWHGNGFARSILSYSSDEKRTYVGQRIVNTGHDIIDGGIYGGWGGGSYGFFQHDVNGLYVNFQGDACAIVDAYKIYYASSIENKNWIQRPVPPFTPQQNIIMNKHGDIFINNGQLLYVSRSVSPQWSIHTTGLPTANITDLKINETGYLYVKMANGELYRTETPTTDVKISQSMDASKYELYQNYPNPFNPSTEISFVLTKESFTTLKVFDLLGRVIVVLVSEEMKAGKHSKTWFTQDLSSGVYFYTLTSGEFVVTKKMVFQK